MPAAPHARRPARRGTATALAVVALALSGCGDELSNAEAPDSPVEVPDIRGEGDLQDAYTGVLDSTVHDDLEAYDGIEMTLLAQVVDVVSPRAFTVTSPVDEDVEPTLVVATADAGGSPEAGDEVVVAVTPIEGFDADVVVDELALEVAPADLEDYGDEIFLLAEVIEPAP